MTTIKGIQSAVDLFLAKEAKRKPRDRVPATQRARSEHEAAFEIQLRAERLDYAQEYRFCERMWRFDFAFPAQKVAVEIEGGIWTNGRHSRGKGMESDMRKYNRAASLGWIVLRGSPAMVQSLELLNATKDVLLERRGDDAGKVYLDGEARAVVQDELNKAGRAIIDSLRERQSAPPSNGAGNNRKEI